MILQLKGNEYEMNVDYRLLCSALLLGRMFFPAELKRIAFRELEFLSLKKWESPTRYNCFPH